MPKKRKEKHNMSAGIHLFIAVFFMIMESCKAKGRKALFPLEGKAGCGASTSGNPTIIKNARAEGGVVIYLCLSFF